jgi:hypothetical protein
MFENIAAIFRALHGVDVTTREELWTLYQRYQLLPVGYKLPGMVRLDMEDRSALIRFCSELTVDWMQPYFAKQSAYYLPREAAAVVCRGRG